MYNYPQEEASKWLLPGAEHVEATLLPDNMVCLVTKSGQFSEKI